MKGRGHRLLSGALLACAMAVVTCYFSSQLNMRFEHHQQSVDHQRVILRGQPASYEGFGTVYFAQAYSRILFPTMLEWGINIFPTRQYLCFQVLRFATAWLFFFSFFLLATYWGGCTSRVAGFGMSFLALGYLCTFNHGWEIPTDFLDGFFLCAFLAASISRSRPVLIALTALAACNRESAVFAGLIWFCLYGIERARVRFKEVAFSVFLVSLVVMIMVLLRNMILGSNISRDPLAVPFIGQQILLFVIPGLLSKLGWSALHPFSWPGMLLVMFLPAVWWMTQAPDRFDGIARRLMACVAVMFVSSLIFGRVDELRIYIPCLVIMLFVAARGDSCRAKPLTS